MPYNEIKKYLEKDTYCVMLNRKRREYFVVNRITGAIQSAWKGRIEATEVAINLNKRKVGIKT